MSFIELDSKELLRAWGGLMTQHMPDLRKKLEPMADTSKAIMVDPLTHRKKLKEGVEPAFYPTDHYSMTSDAAHRAGFDQHTSDSIAAATHNIDYNNFSDAHAHANSDIGETLTHAIEANVHRATDSGAVLHHAIGEYAAHHTPHNASAIVDTLGAVSHQMQDSYAHQGMSFGQHAALDAHHQSPDENPFQRQAAAAMTQNLMMELAAEMRAQGIEPASFHPPTVRNLVLPTPSQVGPMYQYKFNPPSWDGKDTRWPASVSDQMLSGFLGGLHGR